jgi:hypothetical protein
MAKKPRRNSPGQNGDESNGSGRETKSAAIRRYLLKHKQAKPKEVVAALAAEEINVSPSMVSLIRAHAGVRKAQRKAREAVADHDYTADIKLNQASAMGAALTLYKAARGQKTNGADIGQAFLRLVDVLG